MPNGALQPFSSGIPPHQPIRQPKPQIETIDVDLFINFIGTVNTHTIANLLQNIQTYSRPLLNPRVGKKIKVKEIHLLINSQGGVLQLANSFYEFIKAFPNNIPITTYNLGFVDSASVPLFCVGKKRYALSNSRFIVHETVLQTQGELKRVKESVKSSEKATEHLISILEEICKKSSKQIRKDITHHKYFIPEKAKEYGLIDDVKKSLPIPSENDEVIFIAG